MKPKKMATAHTTQDGIHGQVRQAVRNEMLAMQDRWLDPIGSGVLALLGVAIVVFSSESAMHFIMRNGLWIGALLILVAATAGNFFATTTGKARQMRRASL